MLGAAEFFGGSGKEYTLHIHLMGEKTLYTSQDPHYRHNLVFENAVAGNSTGVSPLPHPSVNY
jgi:hypothetical protein